MVNEVGNPSAPASLWHLRSLSLGGDQYKRTWGHWASFKSIKP